MRDPKRIEPFLAKLAELWNNHPDMRFNQLISYINGPTDGFYTEDEETLLLIEERLNAPEWTPEFRKRLSDAMNIVSDGEKND